MQKGDIHNLGEGGATVIRVLNSKDCTIIIGPPARGAAKAVVVDVPPALGSAGNPILVEGGSEEGSSKDDKPGVRAALFK